MNRANGNNDVPVFSVAQDRPDLSGLADHYNNPSITLPDGTSHREESVSRARFAILALGSRPLDPYGLSARILRRAHELRTAESGSTEPWGTDEVWIDEGPADLTTAVDLVHGMKYAGQSWNVEPYWGMIAREYPRDYAALSSWGVGVHDGLSVEERLGRISKDDLVEMYDRVSLLGSSALDLFGINKTGIKAAVVSQFNMGYSMSRAQQVAAFTEAEENMADDAVFISSTSYADHKNATRRLERSATTRLREIMGSVTPRDAMNKTFEARYAQAVIPRIPRPRETWMLENTDVLTVSTLRELDVVYSAMLTQRDRHTPTPDLDVFKQAHEESAYGALRRLIEQGEGPKPYWADLAHQALFMASYEFDDHSRRAMEEHGLVRLQAA